MTLLRSVHHPLEKRIETERFDLIPLGLWQAFRLTYPWTRDTEFIANLSGSRVQRSRLRWYREMVRPRKGKRFVHAIMPHGQTVPIGVHNMSLFGHKSCRLGIGIQDRNWHRKGVATEVRARMLDHLFEHSDVERLYAEVAANNLPSVSNCKKMGFAHVATLHRVQYEPVSGQAHDLMIFEMFREEWMKRRGERNG